MALFWVAIALAAPRFVADDPEHARLALRAWRAATECAGREAVAIEEVPIEVGPVLGGFAGRARVESIVRTTWRDPAGNVTRTEETPGRGLLSIRLSSTATPSTIAHEVAHAWVSDGPPTLVEGATRLLEACITAREPRALPPDPSSLDPLATLVDLRVWANTDDDPSSRSAGYAASEELFTVLADAVPRETLWRHGWTWEALDDLLVDAGSIGAQLRSTLAGGVERQQMDLGDFDDDGLSSLRERLAGTDPARRDSDGDGWWDGAPTALIEKAVALPGGTKMNMQCSGFAAGPLGALVVVRGGARRLAGLEPKVAVDGVWAVDQSSPIVVPAGASIALGMRSTSSGWGIVEGAGLVPDGRCMSVGGWTIIAARGAEAALPPLTAALARTTARADALLGLDTGLHSLWVGEPFPPGLSLDSRRVPSGWLERGAAGEWDYVAGYVVARERLAEMRLLANVVDDVPVFEAFARTLADASPEVLLAALDDEEVAEWESRANACPGGWAAYAAGACGVPDLSDDVDAAEDAFDVPPPQPR